MVLNIIAFVLQGVGAILVGIVIIVWSAALADVTKNCNMVRYTSTCLCYTDNGQSFKINGVDNCDQISSLFSTITAMLVFLVIAAIIALAGSILGCIVVCCTRVSFCFLLYICWFCDQDCRIKSSGKKKLYFLIFVTSWYDGCEYTLLFLFIRTLNFRETLRCS